MGSAAGPPSGFTPSSTASMGGRRAMRHIRGTIRLGLANPVEAVRDPPSFPVWRDAVVEARPRSPYLRAERVAAKDRWGPPRPGGNRPPAPALPPVNGRLHESSTSGSEAASNPGLPSISSVVPPGGSMSRSTRAVQLAAYSPYACCRVRPMIVPTAKWIPPSAYSRRHPIYSGIMGYPLDSGNPNL